MTQVRINKFLADAGIASRRGAEQLILQGKVKLNGVEVQDLSTKVDIENDEVMFNDKVIQTEKEKILIMLNKPVGYVSTTRTFKGEKNVLDLVDVPYRVYPIGRLDKDTSGLLLLTNDGDLALKLTHPRYEKEKEYEVDVNKEVTDDFLDNLAQGVQLDDVLTLPCKVKYLDRKAFTIILKQGINRQIRRMCAEFGYDVLGLHRVRLNNYKLGDLPLGEFKIIKQK